MFVLFFITVMTFVFKKSHTVKNSPKKFFTKVDKILIPNDYIVANSMIYCN